MKLWPVIPFVFILCLFIAIYQPATVNHLATRIRGRVSKLAVNPLDDISKYPSLECRLSMERIVSTVKTSNATLDRLGPVLATWWRQARARTYFVTDKFRQVALEREVGEDRVVYAPSVGRHDHASLIVRMNAEFDRFVDAATDGGEDATWWCHWDDDDYVNVRALVALLRDYDWNEPWYVGKASRNYTLSAKYAGRKYDYKWAHGGAGFCISRQLARLMAPWAYRGRLIELSHLVEWMWDDVLLGFLVTGLLDVKLTEVERFYSHRPNEHLDEVPDERLTELVSVSYNQHTRVSINNTRHRTFTIEQDPTRFLSLHCINFPLLQLCRSLLD